MRDDIPEGEERERALEAALYTLATGATVEDIGKDENGNTKIFRRRLPPNLEAIKYLRESFRPTGRAKRLNLRQLTSEESTTE